MTTQAANTQVKSKIPELIRERGLTDLEWQAFCILAGLSTHTARRLIQGDVNISLATLSKVADALGVDTPDQLVEFTKH